MQSVAESQMSDKSEGTRNSSKSNLPTKSTGNSDPHKFVRAIPPITNSSDDLTPCGFLNRKPAPQPKQVPTEAFLDRHETRTLADEQRRNTHAAAEQYIALIPRLNSVTSSNFVGLLVEVLRGTEMEVSLDDFFHLFFTPQGLHLTPIACALEDPSYQFSSLEATSRGLALCHLIYDTFMDPKSAATYFGVDSTSLLSANINAHEFHRVFLATKILTHCVTEGDGQGKNEGLIKSSIFNMYQIYCLRLFSKVSSSEGTTSSDGIILGQASIGKIMKVMFPKAESKRLGKRGCSKYYFIGVTWTNSPSDSDIRLSIDLEPSQFKSKHELIISRIVRQSSRPPKHTEVSGSEPILISNTSAFTQSQILDAPVFSYVNSSSKFPAGDLSPRVKEITPSSVPLQSDWLRGLMYRSVHTLKAYNVNLEQLIQCFEAGDFSIDSDNSLCTVVLRARKVLDQSSASENAYLHLYLGVLTLVLPATLAFNEEINYSSKILLSASLRRLIYEVKKERLETPHFEKNHHWIFMNLLQKLVNISETISVPSPKKLAKDMVSAIFDNLFNLQKHGDLPDDVNELDEMCTHSIITSLNAHYYLSPTGDKEKIAWIRNIVESFGAMWSQTADDLRVMVSEMNSDDLDFNFEDLKFKILKLFIEGFHKSLSHDGPLLDLPIFVFRYFFNRVDKAIQLMNLQGFGKMPSSIATEMFKTWWLVKASFHEYLVVISEIVALGQALD